jgi:hypothetical protein
MWLDCGQFGKSQLSRITPNSVVLRQAFDAPPGEAQLIVRVDGKKIVRTVNLSRGVSKKRNIAIVYPLDDSSPF